MKTSGTPAPTEPALRRPDLFRIALVFIGSFLGCMEAGAEGFGYFDFASPTQLIFQTDAAPTNGVCRLTPSELHKVGGVWFQERVSVKEGFETTFQFQITHPLKYGADGFAFVLQGNQTPSLGRAGWEIGFGGIPRSLVVKFDNYHWHEKVYQRYDEVAVALCLGDSPGEAETNGIASVTEGLVFSDGKIHTARIKYGEGVLKVFLDDFGKPVVEASVDLATVFPSDQPGAWVGFTAATGADYQTHDLLNWTFFARSARRGLVDSETRASSPALMWNPAAASRRIEGKSASSRSPAERSEIASPADGSGPVLLKVPGGISPPLRFEASTNLVDWQLVTNVTLYFRDADAGKFDHRFYRVSEE